MSKKKGPTLAERQAANQAAFEQRKAWAIERNTAAAKIRAEARMLEEANKTPMQRKLEADARLKMAQLVAIAAGAGLNIEAEARRRNYTPMQMALLMDAAGEHYAKQHANDAPEVEADEAANEPSAAEESPVG